MAVAGDRAAGALYVVATPIGNPEDLSPRARRVLAEADLIASEDTRRAGRMLAALQIRTPTVSYFEHNERRRTSELIDRMRAGESVALISDAGTPAISDPGFRLVRAALDAGIRVAAVPGPSAAIAALSVSGLPTDRFVFEGFLPARESARRAALAKLARETRTIIFYESPRRLSGTLAEMAAAFGEDRPAVVVREITKTYEETRRGALGELRDRFANQEARGEITIVVGGAPESEQEQFDESAGGALTVAKLIDAGLSLKQASAVIAKLTGQSRRALYQRELARRGRDEDVQ
jgi:16S rRNA (cytidine1402-2'-O)-methyltransferase